MPGEVLRLGAVARPDPDPGVELDVWRGDLERGALDDPNETRQRLEQHDRGDAVIVQLGLFADVLAGDELTRIDGIHVGGLWFERGQEAQNMRHACEVVRSHVDEICEDLQQHGVTAQTEQLAQLPVKIEFDDGLDDALDSMSSG